VKSLALSDVYGQLVRLLSLAVEQGPARGSGAPQRDIAERVGASRDMISRLMKDLVGAATCRGAHVPPGSRPGW
jgi:CRP/FNR family cyclic AMP-dependent transcriptional regulator